SSRRPRFSRAGGGRKFQKDGYPRRGGASAFFLNDYGGIGGGRFRHNFGGEKIFGARRPLRGGGRPRVGGGVKNPGAVRGGVVGAAPRRAAGLRALSLCCAGRG